MIVNSGSRAVSKWVGGVCLIAAGVVRTAALRSPLSL